MRVDGRKNDQIRHVKITRHYTKYAEGSVFIEVGDTKVLCNVSVDGLLQNTICFQELQELEK